MVKEAGGARRERKREMAMIGSASRASRGNTMSGSSTDDNPPARPRPRNARGGGGGGESEGSEDEVTERGSEVCQIGDDMCTVPSELFNLPSLKGVLSLNTWNYCLTEEERESLAMHLPPIQDEEVFKDTIRELLGGETFHFTSPMADLFDRLKGGLCHPRVSRYREGLKYLQRKEHYHVLRRYHNHMVSLFVEMQKQWENCPDADIDERLEIWDRFQTEPLPLPKPKRVVRKPGTVRRVKACVDAAPQRKTIPEAPLKMKAIELPKKEKISLKGRSEVGALAPPKKPAVLEPATGSRGVLKIKTLTKDRPEAPSKRIVDIDKVDRLEQEEPVRVNKPRPKGVLKLMPKGKNVLKKTASLAVKGKAPVTEIKREEVNEVIEYEFEEEHALPFEAEVITSTLDPYIPLRETFEEKRMKHKSSADSKKRKVVDIGGGTTEGEAIVKKKKKKLSRELKDQHAPLELPEAFSDQLSPFEGAKLPVDKGKSSGEPKKKPHRKKKIEEITKEPEVIVVEENRAVEDDFRPSDEVYEKPFDILIEEDQVDQVKEEVEVKPKKRTKKKPKAEVLMTSPGMSSPHAGSPPEKTPGSATKSSKKPAPIAIPTLASTFPFSVMHLLSAVRMALITNYGDGMTEFHNPHDRAPYVRERLDFDLSYPTSEGSLLVHSDLAAGASGVERGDSNQVDGDQRPHTFRGVPFSELVRRVHDNPGDHRILETVEPLQDLVRGALKIMGSKVAPAGTKGWKPLVCFDKEMRQWSWIGPPPVPIASSSSQDMVEVQVTAEAWGIPQKSLLKLEDMFASWLKHDQETLQQIDQLPLPPPPLMPVPVDEKERFRDLRAQKSLMTIAPSSEDMRTYFRRQELVRYSLPDRAFAYTTADGGKSVVAPLRRGGGKPTSKARDHFMLKPDRPPHVTILCLVRDAAARLPGSIGTRADVCALIRDSQFIMEDVSDAQVNQVVSGALDRLHYERDPCVRFDGDRKLWVYLHTEREEEDFEDDGTSSTKRWKKPKKDNAENSEHCAAAYETGSPSGADDPSGTGLMDLHSPDGMDTSAIYSVGRTELVYNKSSSLTSPRVLGNGLSRQDDGDLPFITLPPGIDSGHPMGWEGINTQASWDRDTHLQSQESLGSEDEYYMEGAGTAQRHAEAMFNANTE